MSEEIENLSAEIHKCYCRAYERRFGKPYWTNGDYALLDEPTKDYDREMAKFILEERRAKDLRIQELEKDQQRIGRDLMEMIELKSNLTQERDALRAEVKDYEERIIPAWKTEEEDWRETSRDLLELSREYERDTKRLESELAEAKNKIKSFEVQFAHFKIGKLVEEYSALSSRLSLMREALSATHYYLIKGVDHSEYKNGCWCLDENGGTCVYCLATKALSEEVEQKKPANDAVEYLKETIGNMIENYCGDNKKTHDETCKTMLLALRCMSAKPSEDVEGKE